MQFAGPLTLSLAVVLLAAGCVAPGAEQAPSTTPSARPDAEVTTASTNTSSEAASNSTSADANSTAAANATKPADPPSQPSNCMRGMDMQGCTAAQADAYFDAQKANAPPPDKELPPVVIALDSRGANGNGAFTLEPGTMKLMVEVYLNDTGSGPYTALGADGLGDLVLTLTGPVEATEITLDGRNIGADPARSLSAKVTTILDMPAIGDWTITLDGQGMNAQVEVRLIERFFM